MHADDLEEKALELATDVLLRRIPYRELKKKYFAAPSTLNRRLHAWLREGRFELVDRRDERTPARVVGIDEALERLLVRRTGIWRARVAHISGAEAATTDQYLGDPRAESTNMAFKAGDELHRALGQVAAEFLALRLQRGGTIGVAAGRGVAYTVDSLAQLKKRGSTWLEGYQNSHVVSLCGGARVGSWASPDLRDLDADENAFALATVLGLGRDARTLMGPATVDQGDPPQWDWAMVLHLALVGLGVLNTGHHLLRERARLGPLAEPLNRIADFQSRDPSLGRSVAEIGHRLYPLRERAELPPGFADAIDEVNTVVRALPSETLRQAREVVLLAGGAQKLHALAPLVTGRLPGAPIELRNLILVTDAWTAESILANL